MALNNWPDKDPDEILDYRLNWRARIEAGDYIVSSSWVIPAGLIEGTATYTDYTTTVWLSGGTVDTTYNIKNTITTHAGRTMEYTVRLRVVDK